jgi:hypothetical protein
MKITNHLAKNSQFAIKEGSEPTTSKAIPLAFKMQTKKVCVNGKWKRMKVKVFDTPTLDTGNEAQPNRRTVMSRQFSF